MTSRGRLIALEGGEGTGKTTQARRLARHLGAALTFEPGATPIGTRIRDLLLDPGLGGLDARAEALLLAADRAQHVVDLVAPALDRGETVVTDRYIGSSLAYQGHGRQLDVTEVARLSEWATGGLLPDLVVLLELPVHEAHARLAQRNEAGGGAGADERGGDRMEREERAFHERVARGFRELAAEDAERWVVVDAAGTIEDVGGRVRDAVRDRVGL